MKRNIKVDVKNIAAGMYDMFDENEKAALKFGMLPAIKIGILENQLKKKAVDLFPSPEKLFSEVELKEMECIGLREEGAKLAKEERQAWVKDTLRACTLELYHVAPMVV